MYTVDPQGELPPFEQVRRLIVARVNLGELGAGDRLPTVRALAAELGLAPNTVARSYRELEHAGVVETRGRAGTFVTSGGVESEAKAAASAYVDRVRALGLDPEEALDLVRRLLEISGR